MKIGMIGLGAMGLPISKRILEAFGTLSVYDISPEAVTQMASKGAIGCRTVTDVAMEADIVLCSLPNAAIVQGILEEILNAQNTRVKLMADLSSVAPASARSFAELAAKKGIVYLDCPVSGGVGGAENGTLTIMVGGPADALEQLTPVFECIGKKVYHVGDVGAGSGIKMINNYMLGCNMATAAEALVLGKKIGLDVQTMQDIIQSSSGRSFIIENKLPNFIMKRNFSGGFAVDLQYKDLGLAYESAKGFNMPIPMGSTAMQIMDAARAKGYGKQDITSLVKIWEELMDVEI